MSTNKIAVRTTEELMQDYVPIYRPIYPIFMKKKQAYEEKVGVLNFTRVKTVGDIRSKHVTPKDTELKQVAVGESSKTFKKYFFGKQYQHSNMQDEFGIQDVFTEVLDEHQKHADEIFLTGEGTAANNVVNNGLFWSADPNYTTESSVEVDTDADPLVDLHTKIMSNVTKANQVAGEKILMYYGANFVPKFNGLFSSTNQPFKDVLQRVLGPNYRMVEMPEAVTPSSSHGWMIVNLDQIKVHFMTLPRLASSGVNDEKMYQWFNFLMAPFMVEVLAANAIIKQPATLEA